MNRWATSASASAIPRISSADRPANRECCPARQVGLLGAGVGSPVGAAEEDGLSVLASGVVGFPGTVMDRVCLLDKGVYQIHCAPCGLVGAAHRQILLVGKSRPQPVILGLRHPLQQALQDRPCRMGPQRPEPVHLLRGEAVGQRGGP